MLGTNSNQVDFSSVNKITQFVTWFSKSESVYLIIVVWFLRANRTNHAQVYMEMVDNKATFVVVVIVWAINKTKKLEAIVFNGLGSWNFTWIYFDVY